MLRRFLDVTGFVLAGGAGRRMGQPKHTLVLDSETLLSRQLRLLHSVCAAIAVLGVAHAQSGAPFGKLSAGNQEPINAATLGVSPPLMALDVPLYPDEYPGRGPLAGIYTALLRTRTEYNLVIGCDMPYLDAAFLRYLCLRAEASQADVTVPESRDRQLQPLCAVYRRRARNAIRSSLARGQNKVSRFYPHVRCEIIRFPEIARAGFQDNIFANLNTPADFEAARRRK
jgi:molybdopterin-guanine dinucleotide biosynthesis protein A